MTKTFISSYLGHMGQKNGSSQFRPATTYENYLSASIHSKCTANLFLFMGQCMLLLDYFAGALLPTTLQGKSTRFDLSPWVYQ